MRPTRSLPPMHPIELGKTAPRKGAEPAGRR